MEIKWKNNQMGKMNVHEENQVVFLTYPMLDQCEGVYHGFTTRLGGVSKGIFASMNLSFTRGDEEAAVFENYQRISKAIGFPYESIVMSDQTHTTNVRVIGEEDRGNGIIQKRPYTDVDGLVTNVPGLTLA
ncbi:MAG: laccase domain-containing protein, partial [Lachnospiraceae bacterium]|nr:laccase domain-containing protein [Lachnospiraceae bacterium]